MNNLNEKMVNDKNVRDENLAQLVEGMKNDALLESDIWNLGTETDVIETANNYYMTVDMVASLFDCPNTDAVRFYFRDDNPYQKELLEAGMIQVKPFKIADSYNKQDQELKLKVSKASNCNNSTDASGTRFSETVGNTIILKNVENAEYVRPQYKAKFEGIDNTITIQSGGIWLFSLQAVIKLGMFMTGTEKAKLFRDKIINQLAIGQVAQETTEEYFEALFDKENIILYANNTEKLLELLDISFKYDLMKGVLEKTVDPMKQKIRMINARKKEFEKDIDAYEKEVNRYKAVDEDLFFDKINDLETKIEETKRIIAALEINFFVKELIL